MGASVDNSRVGRGRALRVSVASRNDTVLRVASKIVLDVHCSARVADAHRGRSLVGHRDTETGFTLLGSLRVKQSCGVAELPPAEPEAPAQEHAMRVGDLPR